MSTWPEDGPAPRRRRRMARGPRLLLLLALVGAGGLYSCSEDDCDPRGGPCPGSDTLVFTPLNFSPVITSFAANAGASAPGVPVASQLSATFTDPDGDPVSWALSLDPGSPPGTFTPSSGVGTLSSVFRATASGTAVVRVVASDTRGGQAQATLSITVVIGE